MPRGTIERLAVPASIIFVSCLAYGSQILFRHLEPHPLHLSQTLVFNGLVGCLWVTYYRSCSTDPGSVPRNLSPDVIESDEGFSLMQRQRWCRKCKAYKPPRAHHCKVCQRCIPKMDHHCPWIINCVSHRTFPHFYRFLIYSVASTIYLEYLLVIRAAAVWSGRYLPSVRVSIHLHTHSSLSLLSILDRHLGT